MSGTEDSPGVGTWTVEIWTDGMGYPTRRNAVAELFALGKFRGGIGHQVLSQHPERESTTGRTRFRTVAAKKLREATGRPRPRDAFAGWGSLHNFHPSGSLLPVAVQSSP